MHPNVINPSPPAPPLRERISRSESSCRYIRKWVTFPLTPPPLCLFFFFFFFYNVKLLHFSLSFLLSPHLRRPIKSGKRPKGHVYQEVSEKSNLVPSSRACVGRVFLLLRAPIKPGRFIQSARPLGRNLSTGRVKPSITSHYAEEYLQT